MKEIFRSLKEGTITPEEALNAVNKHSTRISDINIRFSEPLKCGFPTLERYEYLVKNESQLVIVAARPGNGKTSLACQIGVQVAEHSRVLFFSLEMTKETLRKRLLSVISQVPIKKLGLPINREKLERAKAMQASSRFDIIDEANLSVQDIIAKVIDEHQREPLSLVIIDYIGLIKVNNEFRATSIGEVAKRLKKDIADKLTIPLIVLAQMNRAFDSRQVMAKQGDEVRPTLADIGESSGIEHAADVVMFLHRPSLTDRTASPSLFKVFVAKNRHGEVKDFSLEFSEELTRFFDKSSS